MYSKCITFWKGITVRNGHMPVYQMQTNRQDEINKTWVQKNMRAGLHGMTKIILSDG